MSDPDRLFWLYLRGVNVLFVCSRNEWRSRTAEHIYRNSQQFDCRSAGTAGSARVKVSALLVEWADVIFVMEQKHKKQLLEQFPDSTTKIIVLDIPDEYEYLDPELVELIKDGVEGYFEGR